jgi:dTDP-glucose 4,6-dehydratase
MRILITGGLGFIGSNFIRYLSSKKPDNHILNVDKIGIGANLENLNDVGKRKNYQFIRGDISNQGEAEKIINDVDAVINFAAETHVDRSIADPKPFIESNIMGTFNLLEAER